MYIDIRVLCLLGVLLCLAPGGGAEDPPKEESKEKEPGFTVETTFMPEECERKSATNDMLSMHYTGWLYKTGKVFDSSRERPEPFKFQIGIGQVIKGWDMGLKDMCVGEKRTLVIPPQFGYGDQGAGEIPAGATLKFDVELMAIADGHKPENIFGEMDKDADERISKGEIVAWLEKGADLHATEEEKRQLLLEGNKLVEVAESILKQEDKNRDGYLTWDEVKERWTHDEL